MLVAAVAAHKVELVVQAVVVAQVVVLTLIVVLVNKDKLTLEAAVVDQVVTLVHLVMVDLVLSSLLIQHHKFWMINYGI